MYYVKWDGNLISECIKFNHSTHNYIYTHTYS